MARRTRTSFDRYFDGRMKDPAFAAEYTQARAEIDAIDTLIRALDRGLVSLEEMDAPGTAHR